MTGIAYQYALAVFSLADEAGRGKEFIQILKQFAESVDEDTARFFAHPKIERQDKMAILEKAVEDVLLLNFLKVLVENDRFSLIHAIVMAYQEILDNLNKVMHVTIYASESPSASNLEKIKKKLTQKYNRTIEVDLVIDTSIMGGVRIEFEGNVIDETINKQIEDIKSSLLE